MKSTQSVAESKNNLMKWWHGEDIGRPLVYLVSRPSGYTFGHQSVDNRTRNLDADYIYKQAKHKFDASTLYGESLPYVHLSIGVGCIASYLGCTPTFMDYTTWTKPLIDESSDLSELGELVYDENNYWWQEHQNQLVKLAKLSKDDGFILAMPDILENLDAMSLLCGSQSLCYHLMDEPELVKSYINQLDDLYFKYYDRIYDIIKAPDGSSGSIFNVWSNKRTLKIQCDAAALVSPAQFEEYAMPSFERQLENIDYSIYHLDGPEAIRSLDMVLSLKNLKALQFTPGDGNLPPEDESWYPIYDKVRKAGKSLWVNVSNLDPIPYSRKLIERYGTAGLYLLYSDMDDESAKRLFDIF